MNFSDDRTGKLVDTQSNWNGKAYSGWNGYGFGLCVCVYYIIKTCCYDVRTTGDIRMHDSTT